MAIEDRSEGLLDFTRLMDGENRKSADLDDVEHWRAVYWDLVEFKQKLLEYVREHIEAVPATEKELAGNDLPFLEAELQRLQRGLAFWDGRRTEIGR